jgi:hypothetical protein
MIMYALVHNWASINLPVGTEVLLLQRFHPDKYVWEDILNPSSYEPFPAAYIKAYPTSSLRLIGKFIITKIEEDKKAELSKSICNSLNAIFAKPESPPAPKPFTRIELKSIKTYLYQGKSPINFVDPDEEDGIYRRLHKRELYTIIENGMNGNPLSYYMYLGDDNLKLSQYEDELGLGYWRDFLFPGVLTSHEIAENDCRRIFGIYNTLREFGEDYYGVVLEPVKMEVRELKEPED